MTKSDELEIGGHNLSTILDIVNSSAKVFIGLPGELARDSKGRLREGGYFTVFDKRKDRIVLVIKIGNPESKVPRDYFFFSQEKAHRLSGFIPHLSSFQSRDPEKEKWGGAIKTKDFILSFSGLPELGDEAVMLLTAYQLGWLSEAEAVKIAQISENPHVALLFGKLFQDKANAYRALFE